MSVVLDGSVVLSWYFEDERTEESRSVLERVAERGGLVPPHWPFEVANGLQMAVRRKRIDAVFRDRALANLATMTIEVDADSHGYAWSETVRLSDLHGLTLYDAAYLELARRRRMTLATRDRDLIKAAGADGVAVIGG